MCGVKSTIIVVLTDFWKEGRTAETCVFRRLKIPSSQHQMKDQTHSLTHKISAKKKKNKERKEKKKNAFENFFILNVYVFEYICSKDVAIFLNQGLHDMC